MLIFIKFEWWVCQDILSYFLYIYIIYTEIFQDQKFSFDHNAGNCVTGDSLQRDFPSFQNKDKTIPVVQLSLSCQTTENVGWFDRLQGSEKSSQSQKAGCRFGHQGRLISPES